MFIYKLTDLDTGEFLIESTGRYPNINLSRYTKTLADLLKRDNVKSELLAEVDHSDAVYTKFIESIKAINSDDTFKLLNGRVRVDEILKEKDEWYLYVIENKVNGKVFIDCTRNVIDKLYRFFICDRSTANLKADFDAFGKDNFKVRIDVVSCNSLEYKLKWIKLFEKYVDIVGADNIYNYSKYTGLVRVYNK